jgi:hypothetical protein
MCYFLYLASPLTLSEVRAMLPPGMAADLLPSPEQRLLRDLHPGARTAARLLIGGCSCDLVIARECEDGESERHLRGRFFGAGLDRNQVIAALEAHRRAAGRKVAAPVVWQGALAAFVAEHARNAGPTLYLLRFGRNPLPGRPMGGAVTLTPSEVLARPATWLVEDRLTTVGG